MSDTILVALVAAGAGAFSAIIAAIVAVWSVKRQTEIQLRQSILREMYQARQNAFSRVLDAYLELAANYNDENRREWVAASQHAMLLSSESLVLEIGKISDAVLSDGPDRENLTVTLPNLVSAMAVDLSVFMEPKVLPNPAKRGGYLWLNRKEYDKWVKENKFD